MPAIKQNAKLVNEPAGICDAPEEGLAEAVVVAAVAREESPEAVATEAPWLDDVSTKTCGA